MKRSSFQALTCLSLFLHLGCVPEGEGETTFETLEQEIRNGNAYSNIPTAFHAIGRVGNCTATLITEYAAITSRDCVTDGANATFIASENRGSITGTVLFHPLAYALDYDIALIRFPASIYDTSSINANLITPISIDDAHPTQNVALMGFGGRDSSCLDAPDGKLSYALTNRAFSDVDTDYLFAGTQSTGTGACFGDRGGPVLNYRNSKWYVSGVLGYAYTSGQRVRAHPLTTSHEWVRKHTARPDIDNNSNLSGQCVVFDGTSPSAIGLRAIFNSSSSNLGFWNNRISSVWVQRGHRLIGYDDINYANSLGFRDGYNGDNCNDQGCFHDLTNTSMDDDISSLLCLPTLPTYSTSDCILYDRPGDNAYSLSGHHANLGTWSNRAHYLWVKNSHTASIYRGGVYTGEVYTYSGTFGAQCNFLGCMHDLSATRRSGTTSSIRCN